MISAKYAVAPNPNLQLFIKIEDPNMSVIWTDNAATKGNLALTTLMGGHYTICFLDIRTGTAQHDSESKRRVTFDLRTGLDAKDYGDIAKKEHLEPLQLEFRKMEDLMDQLNQQLQHLRNRDFEARDTSESTNSRVIWLSAISTGLLVTLGVVQIYAFYAYLKHKKVL